jgi:hypothetical protein
MKLKRGVSKGRVLRYGDHRGQSQGQCQASDNHLVASWEAGDSRILEGTVESWHRFQAERGVC